MTYEQITNWDDGNEFYYNCPIANFQASRKLGSSKYKCTIHCNAKDKYEYDGDYSFLVGPTRVKTSIAVDYMIL